MQLDPEGSYFMPVSIPQRPLKAGIFEDVWTLSTSYETDKDALAALLPVPFEPADEPVVTVHYSQCLKVNIPGRRRLQPDRCRSGDLLQRPAGPTGRELFAGNVGKPDESCDSWS